MCLTIAPPFFPRGCEKQPAVYQTYKILYTEYLVRYDKILGSDRCCGVNGPNGVCCKSGGVVSGIDSQNLVSGIFRGVGDLVVGSINSEISENEKCDSGSDTGFGGSRVVSLPRGPNYERNKAVRERKKRAKLGIVAKCGVVDSRKKELELEVLEARLDREKQQLEISRLFRVRQERVEKDAVSVVAQMDIDRSKKLLEKLRVEQQLKLWDHSVEAIDRRKKEIVARSELNIAKYENMKERKLKLQEIDRKENWREGAEGGGSLPPSEASSKPSLTSSVSVKSSVSQRVSSSSSVSSKSASADSLVGQRRGGLSGSSSSSCVSFVGCVVDDISVVAREKNLDRSKYTPVQQAYIEMKRNDLIVYNCEPGTWLGDVQVVERVNRPVRAVKHVAPVAKVTASDVLKGLLK